MSETFTLEIERDVEIAQTMDLPVWPVDLSILDPAQVLGAIIQGLKVVTRDGAALSKDKDGNERSDQEKIDGVLARQVAVLENTHRWGSGGGGKSIPGWEKMARVRIGAELQEAKLCKGQTVADKVVRDLGTRAAFDFWVRERDGNLATPDYLDTKYEKFVKSYKKIAAVEV